MIRVINALLAIVGGVGGALLVFYVLNKLVEMLPQKWEERLKPYAFILPAVAAIGVFLIYPAVRTIILSFANSTSTAWVGMKNYTDLLSSSDFRITLVNTLLWIAVVPAVVVALGLAIATLADRLGSQGEKLTKSSIFLPMAISGVGAATIWRFIYETRPAGETQIGLQNAIWTALGFDPVAWLQVDTLRLNTFLLMIILIWAQVGFSMVLLSAAVKGVPIDTIEAARIDGANERQIFFRVVFPVMAPINIVIVVITVIEALRAFDIVYIFNRGKNGLELLSTLITNNGISESNRVGFASAIAVILLLISLGPIIAFLARTMRENRR